MNGNDLATAWVSAISSAMSCIVVAIGVVIALGQLRTASRQREDEIQADRTKTTLDYVDQFRHARYLIAWELDANGKPAFEEYSTYWCLETVARVKKDNHPTLTSIEIQCVGICVDFLRL